jgi:hypothetical protein
MSGEGAWYSWGIAFLGAHRHFDALVAAVEFGYLHSAVHDAKFELDMVECFGLCLIKVKRRGNGGLSCMPAPRTVDPFCLLI